MMRVRTEEIELHARNIRKHIIDMGRHAGAHAAHIGGALSIADAMAVLYFDVMNVHEKGCYAQERDRCILSKGHASLGLYAALIEGGFIPENMKDTFEDDFSYLLGHPVRNKDLGIEFTTGSLGMGLSIGVGVAIACRKKRLDNRIYVVMGDGECNEGSCWEGFMSASHFRLDNLTAIIDCNAFQLSGATDDVMSLGDFSEKLRAFGWDVNEVDGHDIGELRDALVNPEKAGKPLAVVMHTVKGKGFSFSENDNAWHHAVVTQAVYEQGLAELGFGV